MKSLVDRLSKRSVIFISIVIGLIIICICLICILNYLSKDVKDKGNVTTKVVTLKHERNEYIKFKGKINECNNDNFVFGKNEIKLIATSMDGNCAIDMLFNGKDVINSIEGEFEYISFTGNDNNDYLLVKTGDIDPKIYIINSIGNVIFSNYSYVNDINCQFSFNGEKDYNSLIDNSKFYYKDNDYYLAKSVIKSNNSSDKSIKVELYKVKFNNGTIALEEKQDIKGNYFACQS